MLVQQLCHQFCPALPSRNSVLRLFLRECQSSQTFVSNLKGATIRKHKQVILQPRESKMKSILTVSVATFICVCMASATINGFVQTGVGYTVPSTNILVLQEVSFVPSTPTNEVYIVVNGAEVFFRSATNGLYTLPRALFLPGGTTINGGPSVAVLFGVLIAPADAPLFVGGGSSFDGVTIAADSITGILQLSGKAAGTKVLFQSSTNLVDWAYDSSVAISHGSDNTKWQFTAPIAGQRRFYRALVRRSCVG